MLFKGQLNDVSFLADNRLVVIIEHQNAINPNMPLRILMCLGRLYEKIIDWRKLYAFKPLKIPWPECIALYNGTDPYPDRQTLNLPDMFEQVKDLKGFSGDAPTQPAPDPSPVTKAPETHPGSLAGRCAPLTKSYNNAMISNISLDFFAFPQLLRSLHDRYRGVGGGS